MVRSLDVWASLDTNTQNLSEGGGGVCEPPPPPRMLGLEGGGRHHNVGAHAAGLSPWNDMCESTPAPPRDHVQVVFKAGHNWHTLDQLHRHGGSFLLGSHGHVHSESREHASGRVNIAGHQPHGAPSAPQELFSRTQQRSRPQTRDRPSRPQLEQEARHHTAYVLTTEHDAHSVLPGPVLPRELSSRGLARALTTASPRWGRSLTSRGSLFEEAVRAKQLHLSEPPQSAPAGAPRRLPTSRSWRGKKRQVATAAGKVEAARPKPNEPGYVPPPYTAPTVPDNQATQIDVVVHAFAPADNLPAAEESPENPLVLPKQQAPYCDLVRRQSSVDEAPLFSDLERFVPDARAIKQMRYQQLRGSRKLLAPPGKGPLARGLQHSHQIRADSDALLAEDEAQTRPPDRDENYYRFKLEKNPSDRQALLGYAIYLSQRKRFVDAEHTYLKLVELPFHGKSFEHANALYAYATFLWQTDRSEKAEHYLQLGLKFNKSHLGILRNLGMTMFLRGAYHGAMEKFQYASRISPTDVTLKHGHVVCLEHIRTTTYETIEKKYEQIFFLQPDYAPALFSYALFCKNHGKRQLAMEYYEKALVVSPNDATVLCSYGVLLSEEAFNK